MAEHEEHHEEGHGGGHGGHGGGHGGGHAEGEHEGAPEWLISFADNVMLQMGFFVILFALNLSSAKSTGGAGEGEGGGGASPANPAMLDLAIGMRNAFNNPVNLDSESPEDQALIQRILEKRGETNAQGAKGKNDQVQSTRPGDYEQICGTVGFSFGSAALTEEARLDALGVAKMVKGKRLIVEVRGHVSEREAHQRDDRGMDLAYARAHAVAKVLSDAEISWRQIRLVAAGDSQPFKANAANAGEERSNERVEIVLTNEVMPDRVAGTPAKSPAPASDK